MVRPTPATAPATRPLWPVASLCVLTGLNLLDYLDRQILSACLPKVQPELGLNDEQAGTIATAFMLGYFLTAPIFGYLGDRLPRRWLIASGVFVWSLGTLLTGHVHTFVTLLLFRALVGFGEASFGTISPAWIADLFGPERRNNALTIFYFAIPVGSAMGYLLGGYMAVHYGWRTAFWGAGYVGIFLTFLLFLLREPARGATETRPAVHTDRPGWRSYFELLKHRDYVLVQAGYVAQTFAMGGFAFWAPSFLVRVHGMRIDQAAFYFSASLAATGLVATLAGGFLATHWQRRTGTGYARMLAISGVLTAPAAFLAFSLPDLAMARIALTITMFLLFLCTGPVNTLILETVPVNMRATSMAASIFAIHAFGDLWSPKVVGYLSDRTGDLQQAILWALPGAMIVTAGFWVALAMRAGSSKRSKNS